MTLVMWAFDVKINIFLTLNKNREKIDITLNNCTVKSWFLLLITLVKDSKETKNEDENNPCRDQNIPSSIDNKSEGYLLEIPIQPVYFPALPFLFLNRKNQRISEHCCKNKIEEIAVAYVSLDVIDGIPCFVQITNGSDDGQRGITSQFVLPIAFFCAIFLRYYRIMLYALIELQ